MASRTAVLLLALVGLAAFVATADAGELQVVGPVLADCSALCWLSASISRCAVDCYTAEKSCPRLWMPGSVPQCSEVHRPSYLHYSVCVSKTAAGL
jgi:hypothetical protein